jgi:hypothetical protein
MGMISALQSENSYFFVHIDHKSGMLRFLQSMIEFPRNVSICEKPICVYWGGFSMVEATVCLMKMVCDSGIRPDYIHLLSGQDFPLRTIQEINQFFENNCGKNFIDYSTIPLEGWANNGGLNRINYKWDSENEKKVKTRLETRPFPEGLQPYGGSQWWSLTLECVEWLIKICRPCELFYDFYKDTLIPDEIFFQTVIMYSPFAGTVVNDNLRYYEWKSGPEYPRILTCEDWDKLSGSGKLFARKFDASKDATILNRLSEFIKNDEYENDI